MLLFISLKQALLHILLICSTISSDDDVANDIPQDEMSGMVNDHNDKDSKIENTMFNLLKLEKVILLKHIRKSSIHFVSSLPELKVP